MAQLPHNPRRETSGRVAGPVSPESPPPLPSLTKPPLMNLCGQQVHLSVDPAVQPALPARLSAPTKRTTQALLNSILEIEPMVTPDRFMKNLSAVLSFSAGSERLRRMLGEGSYANARASVFMASGRQNRMFFLTSCRLARRVEFMKSKLSPIFSSSFFWA